MESARSSSKSQSENSIKNRKRSIAHKLASNVRRQSASSKDDSRNGQTSNMSKELARRMSRIESEDDDEVDNLYRSGLRSKSFQRPLPKTNSVEEYNGQSMDRNIRNNNNNNCHSLRHSKDFIKTPSSSNIKSHDEEYVSDDEDTSDVAHDDYESEINHMLSTRELELLSTRGNTLNKPTNSTSLDTGVGRLPQRLERLSLSPPSLDVRRPPRRSPSCHSISNPNIATSKDFHSNGLKPSWSPLMRRGGDDGDDGDYDDYSPSVQSSKMTSVSSVLSALSTEKIRNRGYLADSTNLGLLGIEELTKLFPERRLRCHASTWNVGEMKSVPESLNDLLLPKVSDVAFDLYVLGVQEAAFDRQEWCIKIQETLGPHFVLFHSASHGSLFLAIFLRRDLIWFLSVPEDCIATTRMGPSNIKTKGAVAVGFILFGTSLLFINSHFKAHEGRFEDRIEDYKKISSSLSFTKISRSKYQNNNDSRDVSSQFDCTFWLGDLNSRMEMRRERIGGTMSKGGEKMQEIEKLLQFDELNRLRTQELAFKGFSEGRIRFLPTYKFDVGTNNYDTSNKNRNPSYTDRILFKCRKKAGISCLHYNFVPSFQHSDHKPVYGVFEIELRPGIDSMPLSGGQFSREVWLAGTRRRITQQTQHNDTRRTESNSSVCLVM